ncbi:hypothetical protein AB4Y45_33005 [Paraburkholderia sp. EG287A]|uniref:hypothetical protein n=1 Tax=Paraburkholderia sp. EG287A TaxID=3237012 RepID=UPI0034D256B9
MMNTAFDDCVREGRAAFRNAGVSAQSHHSHTRGTVQYEGFTAGFNEARHAAHARALDDSLAYHNLSTRDAHIDLAWANRLAARAGQ